MENENIDADEVCDDPATCRRCAAVIALGDDVHVLDRADGDEAGRAGGRWTMIPIYVVLRWSWPGQAKICNRLSGGLMVYDSRHAAIGAARSWLRQRERAGLGPAMLRVVEVGLPDLGEAWDQGEDPMGGGR